MFPAHPARILATGATAVALKTTGLPVRPDAVALSDCAPVVVLSFQLPTVATPDASVTAELPVTVPLPPDGVNVTVKPAMGFALASVTITDGIVATNPPAVAV